MGWNTKRAWLCLAIGLLGAVPPSAAKRKPPQILVQLYGVSISYSSNTPAAFYEAFLILPDGSHAAATCIEVGHGCIIEPMNVEKRVVIPCERLKSGFSNGGTTCYQSEMYWAIRTINDIAIGSANGTVSYHIVGSW